MIRKALVIWASLALVLSAAQSETFTGTAARTGTYKRSLLLVEGKRYELKASDKADPSVAEMLARFSKGDTGTYIVKGTRGTVNGLDTIIVDALTPAAKPLPDAGAAAFATNGVQGNVPPAPAQTAPTVTSKVVTVSNRKYTLYDYADNENRRDLLTMPLLDVAVRTRYPKDGDVTKGPVKLLSIDPATGWVADNTTWKSGLTKIVPAKQFKGDLGHSSWLQTEDIAFIYRAYATYDNPLAITSPDPCGPGTPALDPGSNVPIVVDAGKFPNWKKLESYDGAKKLGTVTAAPAQFTAKNLTPGYHVFSLLGTDAQGNLRTSNPALVVVRCPQR